MPSVIDSIGSLISSIMGAITSTLSGILGLFQDLFTAIFGVISTMFAALGTSIAGLTKTFEGLFRFFLSKFKYHPELADIWQKLQQYKDGKISVADVFLNHTGNPLVIGVVLAALFVYSLYQQRGGKPITTKKMN